MHETSNIQWLIGNPFFWWRDGSVNAGFNKGHKTWLPISTNYKCINVADERHQKRSHLNTYKRLIKLRKEANLGKASYDSTVYGDSVFTYIRSVHTLPHSFDFK